MRLVELDVGLVERGVRLLRRVDEIIQPAPDPLFKGSERFPTARDRQVLKWMGIVTLGTAVGGLVGMQTEPTVLGLGTAVGMTSGFFGSIALANRVSERRLTLPRVDVFSDVIFPVYLGGMTLFGISSEGGALKDAPTEVKAGLVIFVAAFGRFIARGSSRYG